MREPALGVLLAIQRFRRNPPGQGKQFVTLEARVGYALPDEPRLRQRMAQGEPSTRIIPLDISINEPIGAARSMQLGPDTNLRVATLEDIVAEKLRALLQQLIRNRERRQDLLDIAVVLQQRAVLERTQVSQFLLAKAGARSVPVTRTAFRSPEVVRRAEVGYAELQQTTRVTFIPFDHAISLLHALIEDLDIPE